MKYRIRIEWGGLVSYVDAGMFTYVWDGGADAVNGQITAAHLIETKGDSHFFVCGERWLKLAAPVWRSRTNNSLAGVILDVAGDKNTLLRITTTQKEISFGMGDLLAKRYLRWPVGAKYSGVWMSATFQNEGPFAVDAPVEPGCLDLRLPYDAFKQAAHYGLFTNALAAWIAPGAAVNAVFQLPHAPVRGDRKQSAFILELRLSLAAGLEQGYVTSSRFSAYTVTIDGRRVAAAPTWFRTESGCWPGNQWIEFVPVNVPADYLKKGPNRLTLKNEGSDRLTIVSAQLREHIETDLEIVRPPRWALQASRFDLLVRCLRAHAGLIVTCRGATFNGASPLDLKPGVHRLNFTSGDGAQNAVILLADRLARRQFAMPVYAVPAETPAWKVGACMQHAKLDGSGDVEALADYMHDTQMGNYMLFRLELGARDRGHEDAATPELWARWGDMCRERGLYFSMVGGQGWKNAKMEPIGPDPKMYAACRILKEHGREFFFSTHFHEYCRWLYCFAPGTFEEAHGAEHTMRDARDLYVKSVAAIEGIEGVARQAGEAVTAMTYDYAGNIDYIAVETMAMNTTHLFAAARGAARAWGKDSWGIHNATYWVKAPEDFTKLTLNFLNFYLTYLAGGNFAESEDGHTGVPHASNQYGFNSEEPARLREIIRGFYKYVNTHPRKGKPDVTLAVAYGNLSCEITSFPLHFLWLKEQVGNVWGNKGAQGAKWRYGDPERGMILLDELMPYWQDGRHIRHWFTGTPYGQFDLTPVEKAGPEILRSYKTLIFLGWNTMTSAIYANLKKYVADGGALFMAVPHLSQHEDRAFLADMHDLNLINGGDVRDLFGVAIKGPGEPMQDGRDAALVWEPGGTPEAAFPAAANYRATGVRPALLDLGGARVLLRDSQSGAPILVEHRIGKGRAYLLATWAYPGKPELETLMRDILAALGRDSMGDVRLEDHSREIAWSVWRDDAGLANVYLLNTDWTAQGNVKDCRLTLGKFSVSLVIREGRLTTVTWREALAVSPIRPEPYVEDIVRLMANRYRLILHGEGRREFSVWPLGPKVQTMKVAGKALAFSVKPETGQVAFAWTFGRSSKVEVEVVLK